MSEAQHPYGRLHLKKSSSLGLKEVGAIKVKFQKEVEKADEKFPYQAI